MKPSQELSELSRCLANEIAALTNRLVNAQAQEVIRNLDAARKAVEAATTPIDGGLNVPGLADEDIQKIRERLSSNVAIEAVRKQLKERTAATERLTAEQERLNTELAEVRLALEAERTRAEAGLSAKTELEELRTRIEADLTAAKNDLENERGLAKIDLAAVKTELDTERERAKAELDAFHAKLAAAKAEVEDERKRASAELDAARTDLASTKTDLAAARTDVTAAKADITTATAELEAARLRADGDLAAAKADLDTERERAGAELAAMRTKLDAEHERATAQLASRTEIEAEHERLSADLAAARADLDAERERSHSTRSDITRMAAEFEATIDEMRREQLTTAEEQAVAYTSLPLDALLTVFNMLRRSRSCDEVLGSVVDGLAREFSRVALFNVFSNRLEGARQAGFNFESDISKLRLPVTGDSLLSRALSSGRLEAHFPNLHGESGVTLPFGGSPTCAMAIPFVVKGVMVAIIYADDSDSPEFATAAPPTRAKFAELLQHHAALVLLSVALDEKAETDLRKFTSLLIDEMELAHNADASAGKNALERQQTLRHKLESSRRMHAERTNNDVGAASTFEEHLASVAEARPDSPFGRDLATVLGLNPKGQRSSVVSMRR